jgi:hypothetical protein
VLKSVGISEMDLGQKTIETENCELLLDDDNDERKSTFK